jgi:hypothetical protein
MLISCLHIVLYAAQQGCRVTYAIGRSSLPWLCFTKKAYDVEKPMLGRTADVSAGPSPKPALDGDSFVLPAYLG